MLTTTMSAATPAHGYFCGMILLLAPGLVFAQPAGPPDEATQRKLRAVKTVQLEIRQEYQTAEEEFDEETPRKSRETGSVDTKRFLPLLPLTTEIVKLARWQLAATGDEGDVTLRVDVFGTPLGGEYTSFVSDATNYHYTGAMLNGSITLEKDGQTLLEVEFEKKEPMQHTITRSYSKWSDAPFSMLLPEYAAEICGLLGRALGSPVLLAGVEHTDARIREGALRALVTLGNPDAAPTFIRLLADGSDDVSRLAAWGVGALGAPEALPALLDALRMLPHAPPAVDDPGRRGWLEPVAEREPPEERRESVRMRLDDSEGALDRRHAILWALMQIDAPEKKELLRTALHDPASAELRANAALLLGWSEGDAAHEVLLEALQDSASLVRAAAVVALRHAGGDNPEAPMLRAAADADPLVRDLAREALDELQAKRWDSHVAASSIRPAHSARQNPQFVTAAFGHADPLVRAEALAIAAESKAPELHAAICRMAREDKVSFLRGEALAALADRHDPLAVETLVAGLADPVIFVRHQVLAVLSGEASEWEQSAPPPLPESVVEPLMAMQADKDGAVETVDAVLGILQRVQGPAGVRAMERLAREAGPVAVRRQAVKHLARTRPESTWPLLLELAAQTDDDELAYILRDCLVEVGQPAMLDPLIGLLKSDRRASRLLAADVLGRMKQSRAVGPLIAALQVAEAPGQGRDEQLAGGARLALQELTGMGFSDAAEWRQWWKENRGHLLEATPAP